MPQAALTRTLTIIAQDPSVQVGTDKRILRARVQVPFECLDPGPRGYRVRVTDYDPAHGVLYAGARLADCDPFADADDAALLATPDFHAQNVYAIVMRALSHFEAALGRRVSWGFSSHQITVIPHAFADMNAYYSEDDFALLFGYFTGSSGATVHTCLSHDIVAHETTHALLDGLKDSYTLPSSPDQAGFHEGFADVVALLSVFALPEVVGALLPSASTDPDRVDKRALTAAAIRQSVLLGLAEQFGQEASGGRDSVLRRAVAREADSAALADPDSQEPHIRGEIFAAAMLNAFVEVWRKRLESWLPTLDQMVSRDRAVEDGAEAAGHLLTMSIRALDYCPVVDLTFADYLSALLTADLELVPDDRKYGYRVVLRDQFAKWGILPAARAAAGCATDPDRGDVLEEGAWERPGDEQCLQYDRVHHDPLIREPDEVFRFLWENRQTLGLFEDVHTRVLSVRPCVRLAPDGFMLHETVSEYFQVLDLQAGQLAKLTSAKAPNGIPKPPDMPDDTPVRLCGGGVLVFDEYVRLKYHIRSRLDNAERQGNRLQYLWDNGIRSSKGCYGARDYTSVGQQFALMHLQRSRRMAKETW